MFACILDELLLASPHSNLGQPLCECLVGWYPPSRGVRKQLLLGTPHLGGQGGGFTGTRDDEANKHISLLPAGSTDFGASVGKRY